MTQDKALHAFMSGFGITAYAATAVPQDATFPYLTYEPIQGSWGQREAINVNLWYHCTSEATPNAKAQAISDAIGAGGTIVACDDGALWIKRGSPWCQSLNDEIDDTIKRRYILMDVEFLTR